MCGPAPANLPPVVMNDDGTIPVKTDIPDIEDPIIE
jgi:hypothetical protein